MWNEATRGGVGTISGTGPENHNLACGLNSPLRCAPDDLAGLVGKVHAQPTVSIGATPFPIPILLIVLVLITMLIKLHTARLQEGGLLGR